MASSLTNRNLIRFIVCTTLSVALYGCGGAIEGSIGGSGTDSSSYVPKATADNAAAALSVLWDASESSGTSESQKTPMESAISSMLLVPKSDGVASGLTAQSKRVTAKAVVTSQNTSGSLNLNFWDTTTEDEIFPNSFKRYLLQNQNIKPVSNDCTNSEYFSLENTQNVEYEELDDSQAETFCKTALSEMTNASSLFKGVCKSLIAHSAFKLETNSPFSGAFIWNVSYIPGFNIEVAKMKYNSCSAPGLLVGKFDAKDLIRVINYAVADNQLTWDNITLNFLQTAMHLISNLLLGETQYSIGVRGDMHFALLRKIEGGKANTLYWIGTPENNVLEMDYVNTFPGVRGQEFLTTNTFKLFFKGYNTRPGANSPTTFAPTGTLIHGVLQKTLKESQANFISDSVVVYRPLSAISAHTFEMPHTVAQFREVNAKMMFDFNSQRIVFDQLKFGYQDKKVNVLDSIGHIKASINSNDYLLYPRDINDLTFLNTEEKRNSYLKNGIRSYFDSYNGAWRISSMLVAHPIKLTGDFSKFWSATQSEKKIKLIIEGATDNNVKYPVQADVYTDAYGKKLVRLFSKQAVSLTYIVAKEQLIFEGGELYETAVHITEGLSANDTNFMPLSEHWEHYLDLGEEYLINENKATREALPSENCTIAPFVYGQYMRFNDQLNQNLIISAEVAKVVHKQYGRIGLAPYISVRNTCSGKELLFGYRNPNY